MLDHQTHLETLNDIDSRRRQLLLGATAATLLPWAAPAHAEADFEGVKVDDTSVGLGGQKLVLNGVGLRRRGYFKAVVTALYLPEKRATAESILKLDGYRRLQLTMLREFTSSTISRFFIADFKQTATEEEFKKLINVVSQIGATYASIKRVVKGDIIHLDWVPGTGWVAFHNGRQLTNDDGGAINNELAYQIYLRMYIGPSAPEELRNGLLGLSRHKAA